MTKNAILYVEDSADDAFFMRTAFWKAEIKNPLIVLSDGAQGINYLAGKGEFADRANHPIPLIVMLDLNLPIRSGFEVLQWIREEPGLKQLSVVIVSASGQQLDIDLARKYGITDYIIKPPTVSGLTAILCARFSTWLKTSEDF